MIASFLNPSFPIPLFKLLNAAIAFLIASGPAMAQQSVADSGDPNVLLIYADDLGYGDVGCYNPESKVPTPHMDWLATEGIRFTDAHSPSTVCTPSATAS